MALALGRGMRLGPDRLPVGLGLGLGIVPGSGGTPIIPSYDPDAQNLFDRFATQSDAARKQLISDRFVAGKAKSFWAKLDALWVHAAHGPEAARINWLWDRYNCVPVNNPAFEVDRGYMGDGSSSYLDTSFNPATATSPKFTRDSGTLGIRSNTNNQGAGSLAGFFNGSNGTTINPRTSADRFTARVNQATARETANGSVTSSIGMFVAVRDVATGGVVPAVYKDGVAIDTTAISGSVSVAPVNGNLRLGSIANNSYRACQFSMGFVASGLTAQDVKDIFDWFEPYRIAVGVT